MNILAQRPNQLAKKIQTRKKFLNRVVVEIIDLVSKQGVIISETEHSCHTHVVSELRNFGHFSFHTSLDQTMFGGNRVKAWYHPRRNFREGGLDSAWDKEWTPVLNVYFQVDDNYEIEIFNNNVNWQRALLRVFNNKEKIADQIKKTRSKTLQKSKKQTQADMEKSKLIEDAKKLGIIPN